MADGFLITDISLCLSHSLSLSLFDSLFISSHTLFPCNSSIICAWLRRCIFVCVRTVHIPFYCIYHFNRYSTTNSRKCAHKYTPSCSCVCSVRHSGCPRIRTLSALEISSN